MMSRGPSASDLHARPRLNGLDPTPDSRPLARDRDADQRNVGVAPLEVVDGVTQFKSEGSHVFIDVWTQACGTSPHARARLLPGHRSKKVVRHVLVQPKLRFRVLKDSIPPQIRQEPFVHHAFVHDGTNLVHSGRCTTTPSEEGEMRFHAVRASEKQPASMPTI